jgi:acyl-coenzyme A thioesterase PaaI-like protein
VHGGAIAAVLDEAMGAVCWMLGHRVLGARITVNYLQRTPLGFDGWVDAWIERVEGRKVFIAARLMDGQGARYADSEGLFVMLRPDALVAPGVNSPW